MGRLERKIEKLIFKVIWGIVTLPFKLLYLFANAIVSDKRRNSDGYIFRKTDSGREKLEHREIAEQFLGRRLQPWEVVHHINGKRDDNNPSNLCVMSRDAHNAYHAWYDWIVDNYRKHPRRETQLKKLRETFRGQILTEISEKKNDAV